MSLARSLHKIPKISEAASDSVIRDFLESVGEAFEIVTGGYYGLHGGLDDAEQVILRCEVEDERVDICSEPGAAVPSSAIEAARAIAALFDLRERETSSSWVVLPQRSLAALVVPRAKTG